MPPAPPPGSGGGGAGAVNVPTDVRFELFGTVDTVWLRKKLTPIHAANFELLERGGMGAGDFETQVAWPNLSLDGTEFLDIYLFGVLLYRGWVRVPAKNVESPETASIALQSAVEVLNHVMVRWEYAYGGDGADLATIAGDLLADFVAPIGRFGSFVAQDLDLTGILLKEFDARGMSVAQALNKLCDHAASQAIWGMEASWDTAVPPLPIHRLYFRPKPDVAGKYYSIGGTITGFSYPPDTGTVINVVNLTGGPVEQPNLCFNPSFEEVGPAGETVGNLLLDPSFEDNDPSWTLTGARKFTGMDGTARGYPRDGKYWLELDQNTESGIQVVLASFNAIYVGSAWVRQETAGTGRQVKLTIEGLDVTNVVLVTSDTGFVTAADYWEKIVTPVLDCTGQPTVVKIRYRIETNGGTATQDGVLVDFTALIINESVGAVGWRRIVGGVANSSTFEWNYKPAAGARHGGYAVRSDPSAIAGAGDYVELRVTKDKRIEVNPNDRYSLWVYISATGIDYSLGIIEYDTDGTVVATNETATTTTGAAGFVEFVLTGSTDGAGLTTNNSTRSVELFIRHRDNDEAWFDAVFFCQGDIPLDLRLNGDYWPGENYERRFKTSDALFTGPLALSAAADASIQTYGDREQDESNELVIDYASATEWAQDYFNVNAVPSTTARLNIGNLAAAAELLRTTDDKVQVHNLNPAPDALNAVRVAYTLSGDTIGMSADLGSELPSYEQLFRVAQNRERGRSF